MQEDGEVRLPDDDMVDGDLGDGMRMGASSCARRGIHQSFCLSENLLLRTQLLTGELRGIPGLKTSHTHQATGGRVPHLSSISEMSKEDLVVRLQEAAQVIDLLYCELDVTHRYLEGKYEALKILQGKAILEKATTHTKSLLQKSEEKAKALEKEVNSLQWELGFLQLQIKKSEQCWEQKYSRMLSENKALTESLEETESELQQLRAQNAALRREYLELVSMLSVRDQVLYQKTKPPYSPESDAHLLELAVLGACQCLGVNEVCPCSRNAAASRKQVVLLHQELDAQRSRREEALMVADAFRIAFEQQLKKRSEHLLLLAETGIYKSHQCKAEAGGSRSPLISVRQKLRGLLPSSVDVKRPEELLEALYKLMDLLNDKEEALAHQRKVSLMLAHSAEELQKKLHSDETRMEPQQLQHNSSENQENSSENQENSSENQEDSSENQEDSSENQDNSSENQEDSLENQQNSSENQEDSSENQENQEDSSENQENQEDSSENQENQENSSENQEDSSENQEDSSENQEDSSENQENQEDSSENQENQEDSSENQEDSSEDSSDNQGYETCGSAGSEIRNPRAELQQEMSVDAFLQPGLKRSPENRRRTCETEHIIVNSPEILTQIHQNPERP